MASDVLTYITSVMINWETLGSGLKIEGRGEEKYRCWRKEVCERSESFFCQAWEVNSVVSHSVHDFGQTARQTQRNGNSYRSTVISNPVHIKTFHLLSSPSRDKHSSIISFFFCIIIAVVVTILTRTRNTSVSISEVMLEVAKFVCLFVFVPSSLP